MKLIQRTLLILALALLGITAASAADAVATAKNASDAPYETGVITSAGRIHPVPEDSVLMPDPARTYKVVFAVTVNADDPSKVNPALDKVARAYNLYRAAGVPADHLKFVAVVYESATPLVLDDKHFEDQFLIHNPNLPVIRELIHAGVKVVVCAQSVAAHKYRFEWVDPQVPITLSGLTAVTELQQDGYALMQL